jgi:hypothetical protein
LHASRSGDSGTFVTFIYEKDSERLLRHVTGTDEDEVIHQAIVWCERSSRSLAKASERPGRERPRRESHQEALRAWNGRK